LANALFFYNLQAFYFTFKIFIQLIHIQYFTFGFFSENTYLLHDTDTLEAAIIDPGCSKASEKKILEDEIKKQNLQIKYILNTHCHIDHVLGNAYFKEKYQVPILAHEAEEANVQNLALAGMMFGISNTEAFKIDTYLTEADTISLGKYIFEVIFTPGHSPGHLVFVQKEQNFCINGDVLFYGSIGRTDLPGGNFQTLIHSIKQKMFQLPDDMKVFTGHGMPTSIGFEKKNNPFLI
jgi:hydroxyacylglutathione hydrolase